jgi:hypothetical protein
MVAETARSDQWPPGIGERIDSLRDRLISPDTTLPS